MNSGRLGGMNLGRLGGRVGFVAIASAPVAATLGLLAGTLGLGLGSRGLTAVPLILALADPILWTSAFETFLAAAAASALAYLVGVPVGAFLGGRRFPGRAFLGIVMWTPLAMPPAAAVAGWNAFHDTLRQTRPGWTTLGESILTAGFGPEVIRVGPWVALVFLATTFGIPWVALSVREIWRRVDPDWLDAALAAGAEQGGQLDRLIMRPLIRRQAARAAGGVFAFTVLEPTMPTLLGVWPHPAALAVSEWSAWLGVDPPPPRLAILGLLASTIAWGGWSLWRRLGGRIESLPETNHPGQAARGISWGGALMGLLLLTLIMVAVEIPLIGLIRVGFRVDWTSLKPVGQLVSDPGLALTTARGFFDPLWADGQRILEDPQLIAASLRGFGLGLTAALLGWLTTLGRRWDEKGTVVPGASLWDRLGLGGWTRRDRIRAGGGWPFLVPPLGVTLGLAVTPWLLDHIWGRPVVTGWLVDTLGWDGLGMVIAAVVLAWLTLPVWNQVPGRQSDGPWFEAGLVLGLPARLARRLERRAIPNQTGIARRAAAFLTLTLALTTTLPAWILLPTPPERTLMVEWVDRTWSHGDPTGREPPPPLVLLGLTLLQGVALISLARRRLLPWPESPPTAPNLLARESALLERVYDYDEG
ncbi:hypothetical protein Isop_1347 [Isosphaera pallida ATCC 43644]|uniref:Uncharacterized protein n=1 Tax=Isosphaera pallida (strain ATCC 43644 / DSM 9630 / IS1B) TaxID=575540 RepID=E8QX91_ISOPI|nr:hypothetical protein [Isosphaera pallida]ADV61932.1 hypothetical protein Isop_1347 [Isosphaera pallida ATCC 43644]